MADIRSYLSHRPVIASTAYVDAAAVIIGEVEICEGVSIWPGVILRGDQGAIRIGSQSNLQDGTIAHCTGGRSQTLIGERVTVGHRALLHGCIVEDDCLIGMGAILLDNCRIGRGSVVGAGALVTSGTVVPPGSLVLGSPAKVVRSLREGEHEAWIDHGCHEYIRLAQTYREA